MDPTNSVSVPDVLRFDAILSDYRPFGDSSYIDEQMRGAFKRRLEEIGTTLLVAHQLRASLDQADAEVEYRTLGDPVVRCAIQHALWQILTGRQMALSLEQCGDVLLETVHHLKTRAVGSPLESGAVQAHRLGPTSYTGWIWNGERSGVLGRSFQQIMEHEYGGSLCTPSAAEVEMLQKATRLLEEVLPRLSRSALSHAHLVGIFPRGGKWGTVASSSKFKLTGAIFLNKELLRNPWWVAEHLLHELLHQKLYDFRHAHSLLTRDDAGEFRPFGRCPHSGVAVEYARSRCVECLGHKPGCCRFSRLRSPRAFLHAGRTARARAGRRLWPRRCSPGYDEQPQSV